jgi:hypothetical protein
MTKKSKETTVELKPVEVVEKVLDSVVAAQEEVGEELPAASFDMDNQGIPFLKPAGDYSVSRPYRTELLADGIVEVAGKTFTGRDVTPEEVSKLGLATWSKFSKENILVGRSYHKRYTNQSYHANPHAELLSKDVKFKHYHIAGVDIYITNGSKLTISQRMNADLGWEETPHVKQAPKLVIVASELSAKSLVVAGDVSLKNASVTGDGMLTLIDSSIEFSTICGSHQYSTIDDTHLYGVYLHAQYSVTITDTDITGASITGVKSINMDRASGGNDFTISMHSMPNNNQFSFKAANQYLHPYVAHGYGKIGKGYEPVSDYAGYYEGEWMLTVERRIDYGMFAATKPVPFVRVNQCDIMVGDQIFSIKEFFPELVTEQEPPKLETEQRPGGWGYTPPSFPIAPFGGQYSRSSALWKKAASIAFEKEKAVIGKVGETIVNSLLDQIRSRINIYAEISTLN